MNGLAFSKRDNYSRCKNSAIYSLAMREHSRQEIYNKLSRKDYAQDVDIYALLDELEENNYLNEQRFTESFIRSRSQRGQGPNKISNDLKLRGIDTSLINSSMINANIDWYELTLAQRIKKFGEVIPLDYKEKTKQMRFLSSRGFHHETIRSIF